MTSFIVMEPKTYHLTPPQSEGGFYNELHQFANDVWVSANFSLGWYADDYFKYIKQNKIEAPRSKDEYLLELVITGVLVKNYYFKAKRTAAIWTRLLNWLYALRKKHQGLKTFIDKLRGVLGYALLHKQTGRQYRFSAEGFRKMLQWLGATGEFTEEVIRLEQWIRYYETKTAQEVHAILLSATVYATHFEDKGKESLDKYVCNVNRFVKFKTRAYRFREDYFFVSRSRNEYFMNMLGAEILNRQMRPGFMQKPNKAVLLPTCMCRPPARGCGAMHDGKALVCMRCSGECNAGKIAAAMKKHKVKTYLIPHSSGFSKFLRKWENSEDTGLVGVTCILNLLAGGYEMKRLNIAAQCIFLDYCSCKKHWDRKGFATCLDIEQLEKIVCEEYYPL